MNKHDTVIDVLTQQRAPERGEGLLPVDTSHWEDIGKPETPDAWRKALLLPESYEIEHVEHSPTRKQFVLHVWHEAIPVVPGAFYLPRLILSYLHENHDGQSHVSLACVDICVWSYQEGWQSVAVLSGGE